jgi:hypothetical protein
LLHVTNGDSAAEQEEHGSSVLDGCVKSIELLPLDRWIGGVRLTAGGPEWLRDAHSGRLIVEQH